jgi:hypothetical protein
MRTDASQHHAHVAPANAVVTPCLRTVLSSATAPEVIR